ncbi:hypothetical protein K1719_001782 [Acacia pycnantha]|nr:hypothetical protein K1719_001782 [Acacia pycnantha]
MKGTSLVLVIMYSYLNPCKLSFSKVTKKVLVCGKIMCGLRFKQVVMPMEEIAKLRYLLPFVRKVELLESPIEFGNDLKQHYHYDYGYDRYRFWRSDEFVVRMKVSRRRKACGTVNNYFDLNDFSFTKVDEAPDDDSVVKGIANSDASNFETFAFACESHFFPSRLLKAEAISKAISCKDVVHSIPTVSSPSYIVSAPTATKYGVFLSFRGEDTHDAFSSFLYEALCNANIHTFIVWYDRVRVYSG